MSEVEESRKRERLDESTGADAGGDVVDNAVVPITEEEECPKKLAKMEEDVVNENVVTADVNGGDNGENTNGDVDNHNHPHEELNSEPNAEQELNVEQEPNAEQESNAVQEQVVANPNDDPPANHGDAAPLEEQPSNNPGHEGTEEDPPAETNETAVSSDDPPAKPIDAPSTLENTEIAQPDYQGLPSGDALPGAPTDSEAEQYSSHNVKVEEPDLPEQTTESSDVVPPDPVKEEPFALDYTPAAVPPPMDDYTYDTSAQAANMSPSNGNPESSIVEERGEVPAIYIGRVIGKGGEMIRDLQARAGCRMDVDPSAGKPGASRIITYRGTRKTVDFAKHLVQMLCSESIAETDLPLGEAHRKLLVIPAHTVGKIIGRGGEMIRELQSRSQARIQVDHSGTSGLEPGQKQVTITGSEAAVVKAEEMVSFLVNNPMMDALQALNMLVEEKLHRGGAWGSGPPYPNLPNQGVNMQPQGGGPPGYGGGYDQPPPGPGNYPPTYSPQQQQQPPAMAVAPMQGYNMPNYGGPPAHGGPETELFRAPRVYLGRIIGAKGVTINDLQRRSGCDIQINQESPHGQECEISIRGPRQGIEMVKQMIREIIDIGPNHPYAGGADQQGGYQQVGYGQGGYQQGGYGYPPQPYGYQNPMAPPSYGQPYEPPYQAPYQGYGGGYDQRAMGGYYPPAAMHQPYPAAGQPPYGYETQGHPPVPVSASAWKSATAPDGQVYYYNERTGETQWDKPMGYP